MPAIKPSEVGEAKEASIPDAVLEAFNEAIIESFADGCAIVRQRDVETRIARKTGYRHATIIENGWLNVEEIYRRAGWIVDYDKPGYNENYEAYFTFKKKR